MFQVEPVSPNPPHRIARPVMRQTWQDLTFIHWPFEAAALRRLVPGGLELDLYDGKGWIGLVPFAIAGLTLPSAPAVPWLSNFPETNLRTYVVDSRGLRGVWFFSLDAARLLAVLGARVTYGLPYFWARMNVSRNGQSITYRSTRHSGQKPHSAIEVRIGDAILQPSEFEVFLTARFRLYAQYGHRLVKADAEHRPWELRGASLDRLEQNLVEAAGLPSAKGEPLVHFGGTVNVLIGGPTPA
jgi:uncharacterized protein YqjF (DUF2071 family)